MLETGSVIGMPVTAGTLDSVADAIIERVKNRNSAYICVAAVHTLVNARRHNEHARILAAADFVTSDGMPIVWALRRQGFPRAQRVYGPDLMLRLCQAAEQRSLGVYFVGSTEETLQALRNRLTASFPKLAMAGFESPSVPSEHCRADPDLVERIRSSRAQLVFVGLGSPKQEYWMAEYAPYVEATLLGVGAAFDFVSGTKAQAPQWMRKRGLEWLFRLMMEPRRLWKRYLIMNTLFIYYLVADRLGKS